MARSVTLEFSDEAYEAIVSASGGDVSSWGARLLKRASVRTQRSAEHRAWLEKYWGVLRNTPSWGRIKLGKHQDNMGEVVAQLTESNTPDRSVAIIGGAMLEYGLAESITRKFWVEDRHNAAIERLFEQPLGALSSMSCKADMAHAMRLFGPVTYRDVGLIGKIRNRFAHRLTTARFSDEDIAGMSGELELPKRALQEHYQPKAARDNFVRGVILIDGMLSADSAHRMLDRRGQPFLP